MAAKSQKTDTPEAGASDTRRRAMRIRAGALLKAVKSVGEVVQRGNSIPVLTHVLLQAGEGRAMLTGTSLDCWAWRSFATDDREPNSAEWMQNIRPFAVTLPEKQLRDLLGEIDADAMVTIEAPAEADAQWRGAVTVQAGRARYKLHSLPVVDFPGVPPFSFDAAFELPCTALADAFAAVEHAISSDPTRYYINGIFLHSRQREGEAMDMRMAATDGHRLARLAFDLPEGGASFPGVILARQTVALLDKLLGEAVKEAGKDGTEAPAVVLVEAGHGGGNTLLQFGFELDEGEITVLAKPVDGTFPDYERVIPAGDMRFATINRADLMAAIRRVSVLCSKETRLVKARFGADVLELAVQSPELGEAREEIPCEWDGPEVTVGFNGQYWRELLAAAAADFVEMGFTPDGDRIDPMAPVLLRAGDSSDREERRLVQVIMPVRF